MDTRLDGYYVFAVASLLSRLLDLDLSITNDIVASKIYDKWDDFNLEI